MGDTCYSRKIKCDMTKPVCSNCQLYKVRCTTTLIRRRAMAPEVKPADVTPPGREHDNHNESLEARLKGIEARLDSLGASPSGGDASLASLLGYPSIINNTHDFSPNVMDLGMLKTPDASEPEVVMGSSSNTSNASSMSIDGSFLEMPPLHEALPVIETYFRDFNSMLPLHHEPTFMKLLHRCYSGGSPEQQSQRA
ncbi:hypothetical protein PG993_004724 [Apiospora rasikravindrae]|uniref:Zn(2)-C6 fungal-type domain-containing protein n=1 Tax=Apiospora rasikravindrae TaxID=990691 RepID=A0ABR1TDJ8_9PEZI